MKARDSEIEDLRSQVSRQERLILTLRAQLAEAERRVARQQLYIERKINKPAINGRARA